MKEEFISFETAKLAKEKGYKIEPDIWGEYALYKSDGLKAKGNKSYYLFKFEEEDGKLFPLITQSLFQKWLRDKHNIDVIALPWRDPERAIEDDVHTYRPMIFKKKTYGEHNTYELALEEGLKEALKLIKTDTNGI